MDKTEETVMAGEKTFSFEWLSGCSGCEVAFADLHEKLPTVLKDIRLVRFPILMDTKNYVPADFGVITGSIRTGHDVQSAHKMRESCGKIVALGSCPVYGGPHAGNLYHSKDEMLNNAFQNNPTTRTVNIPDQIPSLLTENHTLDSEITVDFYLPGCPPHTRIIVEGLRALIDEDFQPKFGQHNICHSCVRKMDETEVDSIRRNYEGTPDPELCFLSQGYLCFGSVALDRCLAPCPKAGVPCFACGGPAIPVLLEPQKDLRALIAERMSQLTQIPEQTIIQEITRHAKTHYLFLNGSPMLRNKPTTRIEPFWPEGG
jgi:F420-non-reducing hydrogenase small subunit